MANPFKIGDRVATTTKVKTQGIILTVEIPDSALGWGLDVKVLFDKSPVPTWCRSSDLSLVQNGVDRMIECL